VAVTIFIKQIFMQTKTKTRKDTRQEKLLEQIERLSAFDCRGRLTLSENGDETDAIAAGLNTLAEELNVKLQYINSKEERINNIIDILMEYTVMDFSKKISLSEHGDEVDAISAGLNTMAEELDFSIKKQNRYSDALANVNNLLMHNTEELKRSNAELEQFAYVASHDLQEPLRMITSYVQLLEKRYKPKLDGDAIEFINYAVDGANRMQTLIYSLLEYSRVNRVKPFESVNVSDLLVEIKKDLSMAIEENNAEIIYGELPDLYGDKVLLGQLFFNLIGNAIKFKGKDPVKITISGKKTGDEYLFSVADNGIGIQKEYLEKIFIIFQRLHTKDKYPGTGIGLAICKKIVERHNGRIWVDSKVNEGSVFYFTINTSSKNNVGKAK
jgi:signal transduction histidine kinase